MEDTEAVGAGKAHDNGAFLTIKIHTCFLWSEVALYPRSREIGAGSIFCYGHHNPAKLIWKCVVLCITHSGM
jgi:hypothetical protein